VIAHGARFLKKGFYLSIIVVISVIFSLPREVRAFGQPLSTSFIQVQSSHHDGRGMQLMHIRKFRRRQSHFIFNPHLSATFLSDPFVLFFSRLFFNGWTLLAREPDPLVHPPA